MSSCTIAPCAPAVLLERGIHAESAAHPLLEPPWGRCDEALGRGGEHAVKRCVRNPSPVARGGRQDMGTHVSALYALTDEETVHRWSSGDLSAFAEIYRRHHPKVYGICWRMLNNKEDAECAMQETFTGLYKSRPTVERLVTEFERHEEEGVCLSSQIYTRANSRALDALRKRRRELKNVDWDYAESEASQKDLPDADHDKTQLQRLIEKENQQLLRECLSTLTREEREIIKLRDLMELSWPEIVVLLRITREKARYRHRTARESLARCLRRRQSFGLDPSSSGEDDNE